MKEKIAITGAKGIIGQVLTNGLSSEYDITPLDLPETDVSDYQELLKILPGHSAVIHLAWNSAVDNFRSEQIDPKDAEMFFNVYRATLEVGVPRVIMASSVHVDRFDYWKRPDKMSPGRTPFPDSPYGALKVGMEAMGRYYASRGQEVVCIRFGGVNPNNVPPEEPSHERAVWLSHSDCVSMVKAILEAKTVPDNFAVMYGMSDNLGRIHDISNPFGWVSKDSAPVK